MARATDEWIAKHDDQAIPPKVRVRIFTRFAGICPKCTRKLEAGKWQADHIKALINGGEHREGNLWPLCTTPCHSQKTVADLAEKSRVYRKTAKHIGVDLKRGQKLQSRGFPQRPPQLSASRPLRRKGMAVTAPDHSCQD